LEAKDYWTYSDDQLEEELRIRATRYDGWEFSVEEREDARWVAGFQEDSPPDGDPELKAYFMAALKTDKRAALLDLLHKDDREIALKRGARSDPE
jgi:hypothetical protein